MTTFPHLKFIQKIVGKPRLHGGGGTHPASAYNKSNRQEHSGFLSERTSSIKQRWIEMLSEREHQELAPIDAKTIPVFLKINPEKITSDFDLEKFGIEIISEEQDGFIIGASSDELKSLEDKIKDFIDEKYGSAKIAEFWEIVDGNDTNWKPEHILSEELFAKWSNINDTDILQLEVGIAFNIPLGKEPDPTKQGGDARLKKYREKQEKRDELLMARETNFENFIGHYGVFKSGFAYLEDSFSCEVEISGKGLKDLVRNYPFVFDVSEKEEIGGFNIDSNEESTIEFEILPPDVDAPEIGIIDSGIMENHKYLAPAIKSQNSKSYVNYNPFTTDEVLGGGHGTKVAGAVLYPYGISNINSDYQLPCFVRNIRVLDKDNALIHKFPAELMTQIINDNDDCTVFNLSINSKAPFRKKHMSSWAATIDSLIHNNRIMFIISAGNIDKQDIRHYLNSGVDYPNYLNSPLCGLANPAQSSFGLVVGSINHSFYEDGNWKSLGGQLDVSAYSRIGNGIWDHIKPDVVEYGGGLVSSKNGVNSVRENEETSTELIRSTLSGGNAYSKDSVGTSFATPKVTHIVAQLLKLYPNEDINLIKALVIQGARLPKDLFLNPTNIGIKQLGYGLPSIERVTNNTTERITFYNTETLAAEEGRIYSLKIPENLRNQADEYDILIEVTLTYTAEVRRTRQKTKSYLSTWLDWTSSYLEEPLMDFTARVIKEIEEEEIEHIKGSGTIIPWKIRENKDWGKVQDLSRNNSTTQKDWAIIKSYQLPEELNFSVRGHKSWDKNFEPVPFALVVSIEALNENIDVYESIRIENEIELPVEV
tara:strand:- start:821 stop:3283 length:2463 start_codon:yes stop_codon:yes gene_type:complete